jgi:hypothetical protein
VKKIFKAAYMLANLINTLKQTARIFTQKDFTKNPNAPHITEEQKKALWVGLINSEQIAAYTDSLTTGLPRERILQGLTEAWGIITNAYETAKKEFKDWHEAAVSHLIGRGAWGGDTILLKGLCSIAEKAFEDDSSPWKNVSLKQGGAKPCLNPAKKKAEIHGNSLPGLSGSESGMPRHIPSLMVTTSRTGFLDKSPAVMSLAFRRRLRKLSSFPSILMQTKWGVRSA